jgi:hypothetical protein
MRQGAVTGVAVKCGVDMLGGMLYVLLRAPPPGCGYEGPMGVQLNKGPQPVQINSGAVMYSQSCL